MNKTTARSFVISFALVAALAPACKTKGPDEAEIDTGGITGTYELKTIAGNPLPYAPEHLGRQQPTVVAGDLTLREGGAFGATMEYSNDAGRIMTRAFTGLYAPNGDGYLLEWQGAGTTQVTIEGDELTLNNEGMLFVYKKALQR